MSNIIKIKEHNEGRLFFHYKNIVCLVSEKFLSRETKETKIFFYNIEKGKIVDILKWNQKLEQHEIICICHSECCVFVLSKYQGQIMLVCMDLENYIWQECVINRKGLPSLHYDSKFVYVDFCSKNCTEYYRVLRNTEGLSVIPLFFLKGNISEFKPYYAFYQDKLIFQVCGDNIEILDKNELRIKKFPTLSKSIIVYDGLSFEVIVSETTNMSLEYDTFVNNKIYYELNDGININLYEYNLKNNERRLIPLANGQNIALSYEDDIFIYSQSQIHRLSDNKIIKISSIMNAIQKLNIPEIQEIAPFDECWFFHDYWIEAEIENMHCFLVNLETMESYYFENMIDIDGQNIYLYEKPFYYMIPY